ncbi:MAG: hypothetical protein ACJ786_35055 [Catenulispora sp.]
MTISAETRREFHRFDDMLGPEYRAELIAGEIMKKSAIDIVDFRAPGHRDAVGRLHRAPALVSRLRSLG